MKKQFLIIGAIVVLIVGAIFWFMNNGTPSVGEDVDETRELPNLEASEVTYKFYKDWLKAQSTDAEFTTSELLADPLLSEEVRAYIETAQQEGGELDPVLCQTIIPKRVAVKPLFALDYEAKMSVLGRGGDEKTPEQAVVSLEVEDGVWVIKDITCAYGESAPEREFSFEREGFLLKSVPPPLDPQYWHIVFEQNGQKGHTVPLFFDAESTCIALDASEAVCDESHLSDALKARVQGDMSEAGATVKRLEILPE